MTKNNYMQLGFVGLGRMGKNMVLHLKENGIDVVAWNRSSGPREEIAKEGIQTTETIDELIAKLETPRTIWLMVTAGDVVEELITQLSEKLSPGDLIIEGGNSNYKDSQRRSKHLAQKDIHFMDVGTSGGIESARSGACLMIGGTQEDFNRVEEVFKAAAAPGAYGLLGPAGAGHFAKMVHNGIEYGIMESIGEGATLLKCSDFNFDLSQVFKIYNNQSIIQSRLVGWALNEFEQDKNLTDVSSVIGSGGTSKRVKAEGDWTQEFAKENSIDIPAIEASVRVRDTSSQIIENSPEGFRNKVISAMRGQFGGHPVKKEENKGN